MDDFTTDQALDEAVEDSGTKDQERQRDRIKEQDAEIKELRNELKEAAFREAGFDPATGAGSLLFEVYRGERNADAVRAFAEEKGVELPPRPQDQGPEPAPSADLEQRVDDIHASSTPNEPAEYHDEVDKAVADDRFEDSIALKAERAVAQMDRAFPNQQ